MEHLIISEAFPMPPKGIIYGEAGVGKSTTVAFEGGLLLDFENKAAAIRDISGQRPRRTFQRTPHIKTFPEAMKWLAYVRDASSDVCTGVVVDTLDWLMMRAAQHVVVDLDAKKSTGANALIVNTVASSHGGYNKGKEVIANLVMRELIPMLDAIVESGKFVILLAHARNGKITSADGTTGNKAIPDLDEHTLAAFVEWSNFVLYLERLPSGERQFLANGTGNVLAKNTYGMPDRIAASWPEVCHHVMQWFAPDEVEEQASGVIEGGDEHEGQDDAEQKARLDLADTRDETGDDSTVDSSDA